MTKPPQKTSPERKPAKKAKPEANAKVVSNREAAEIMVQALRAAGRLGPVDEARVLILMKLATMVDSEPENPALWREYRAAEKSLREETPATDDPFEALIQSLSTEIRHETKPQATQPRS